MRFVKNAIAEARHTYTTEEEDGDGGSVQPVPDGLHLYSMNDQCDATLMLQKLIPWISSACKSIQQLYFV